MTRVTQHRLEESTVIGKHCLNATRSIARAIVAAILLAGCMALRYQSTNFVVSTADPDLAVPVAKAAEKWRHDLAIEWLGAPFPIGRKPAR